MGDEDESPYEESVRLMAKEAFELLSDPSNQWKVAVILWPFSKNIVHVASIDNALAQSPPLLQANAYGLHILKAMKDVSVCTPTIMMAKAAYDIATQQLRKQKGLVDRWHWAMEK